MPAESFAVIAASTETGSKGDFRDGLRGAQQQVNAFIKPVGNQVLIGRLG